MSNGCEDMFQSVHQAQRMIAAKLGIEEMQWTLQRYRFVAERKQLTEAVVDQWDRLSNQQFCRMTAPGNLSLAELISMMHQVACAERKLSLRRWRLAMPLSFLQSSSKRSSLQQPCKQRRVGFVQFSDKLTDINDVLATTMRVDREGLSSVCSPVSCDASTRYRCNKYDIVFPEFNLLEVRPVLEDELLDLYLIDIDFPEDLERRHTPKEDFVQVYTTLWEALSSILRCKFNGIVEGYERYDVLQQIFDPAMKSRAESLTAISQLAHEKQAIRIQSAKVVEEIIQGFQGMEEKLVQNLRLCAEKLCSLFFASPEAKVYLKKALRSLSLGEFPDPSAIEEVEALNPAEKPSQAALIEIIEHSFLRSRLSVFEDRLNDLLVTAWMELQHRVKTFYQSLKLEYVSLPLRQHETEQAVLGLQWQRYVKELASEHTTGSLTVTHLCPALKVSIKGSIYLQNLDNQCMYTSCTAEKTEGMESRLVRCQACKKDFCRECDLVVHNAIISETGKQRPRAHQRNFVSEEETLWRKRIEPYLQNLDYRQVLGTVCENEIENTRRRLFLFNH